MINTREIIVCKELIDIVDDILHERLFDEESSRMCDKAPSHKGIMDVFDSIVDAHNEMLGVYCHLYSEENEHLCGEVRKKFKELCDTIIKEGGQQ